ncbi:MAG TPA: cytochrome c [Pseudolabrys sp.]
MRRHKLPGALAAVAAAAVLTAALLAGAAAPAQEQPSPRDTIFARKILMGAIDMNMDEIETMLLPEGKLDLNDAQEHAETISTMLMAFPHMFPASTNQWKPGVERDPAYDTFAAPEVWSNFADFYARATEASKIAWAASRAKRAAEFRPLIAQLREHCNACHAVNAKFEW